MKWFFLSLFIAVKSFAAAEMKEFDAKDIKRLKLEVSKGEIQVSSNKNNKAIKVSIDKIQFDPKCRLKTVTSAGTLEIAVEHENAFFEKSHCVVKLSVTVPDRSTSVDVTSSNGQIKISDIDGKVEFATASGDVEIAGDVLKNISGKTASGNVTINYHKCAPRADVDLLTASGDTLFVLSPQCKIRVNYKSAAGELFNELGDSEDYQLLLTSKSASGNLKIKKGTR